MNRLMHQEPMPTGEDNMGSVGKPEPAGRGDHSKRTTKISVLICTRDRPDTVGQAVESVARCDHLNFDLHVLDQSTTDATQRIVESLVAQYGDRCSINYHRLLEAGLSRAYNIGVRVSDGSIIACTDDDVIVPTDWLSPIVAAFENDPDLGLLYGQVLVPKHLESAPVSDVVIPALEWSQRRRLFHEDRNFEVWGMGANMAFRREAFSMVNGFDEAMGGGGPLRSSQDFDFSLRVYRSGFAILLEPDVKVDHYGARTREQWPATMHNYGVGDGAFYSKHIRCGDLLAARLLLRTAAKVGLRMLRDSVRERRFAGISVYGRGVAIGVREGARFDVDRQHRLFRATARSRTGATEANAVDGTVFRET
jgi:glycosyltransferase involved in cell wall biosynthesis